MGDKSPKSKQKNQSQKQSKNLAADQVRQKNITDKQADRSASAPGKKKG